MIFASSPPSLDGDVRLRGGLLQRCGHGHDLLHKLNAERLAEVDGAGAGDADAQHALTHSLARLAQKLRERLLRVRLMAPVFSEENLAGRIEQHQLDGSGADVDPGAVALHVENPPFVREICQSASSRISS